jgi:hypothetical protein
LRAAGLTITCVWLAACGSGGGSSSPPASNPPPPGGIPNLQATFTSIQDNVFTPICTACHVGATAPQGLRLDAANSYGLLVGVASAQAPTVLRVAPGNPGASYLIQKLEGTATVGGRMPLNGTPLAQGDIDIIRQWITDGAQAAPPPPAAPIRMSSLSPLPESVLTALPASITAMFDRAPDASTVNSGTFLVDRSGGDGTFEDGNEVAVTAASITVPAANTSSAVFDLAGAPAADDTYRVRLLGAAAGNVQDADANALDGEFSGSFPSGDGTAGGDFVATFLVSATEPTLTSIQTNVFTPRCAGCHTGPAPGALPAGMDLSSAAASHASLVGVASIEVPSLQRVSAGDPANSYLIHKLEGTQTVGARMPLTGQPLDHTTITIIRLWITDGANP